MTWKEILIIDVVVIGAIALSYIGTIRNIDRKLDTLIIRMDESIKNIRELKIEMRRGIENMRELKIEMHKGFDRLEKTLEKIK